MDKALELSKIGQENGLPQDTFYKQVETRLQQSENNKL